MTEPYPLTSDNEAFVRDLHGVMAALRSERVRPVTVFDGRPAWLVTRHADAVEAYVDPRLSNDDAHLRAWEGVGRAVVGRPMLQEDPPTHTRMRRLIAKEFTNRRTQAMRPAIERHAQRLLDQMADKAGPVDLVADYALPLPLAVICDLLGVPEGDREDFHSWSNDLSTPKTAADGIAAQRKMEDYLSTLINGKRSAPGGDLLSALVQAHDDNDTFTDEELLGTAFLLLVGGHESTAHLISTAVMLLVAHPEQRAMVAADPELMKHVVEEVLRIDGPVEMGALRYATQDMDLAGVPIAAGDVVLIGLSSAGRDPARFTSPDEFRVDRDPTEQRDHLAFGRGVHHCIGAPLARLEGEIALRALFERFPKLAVAGEEAPQWAPPTFFLHGLARLDLHLK
ncbi:cytochrome P450 family protein [Enemella evansiae]|uniref:cytochrome P450 family protein n=1 Tax=Enemella evansiae TaxID=2016499 RepID=UPI001595C981|nr:cytochrome P450 [Enemella evansiae]